MDPSEDSRVPAPPPPPPPPLPFYLSSDLLDDDPYKEKRRQKELQFRLVGALEQDNPALVRELLDAGVNPNCSILLVKTPLLLVLEQPEVNLDILHMLLEAGADANLPGTCRLNICPLHVIAKNGHLNIAKILLEGKTVSKCDINFQDRGGATPLQFAVQYEHRDMVKYLLEKGARFDLDDIRGRSVFHRACETQNLDIAEILLSHGHDVNKADWYSWTPIFQSVFFAQSNMVKFLIDKGANLNIKDRFGQSLLMISGLDEQTTVSEYKVFIKICLHTSFGYEAQEWGIPTQEMQLLLFRLEGGQLSMPDLFEEYYTITSMLLNAGADPRLYPITSATRRSKNLELLLLAGSLPHEGTVAAILESDSHSEKDKEWFQAQVIDQSALKHQCRYIIRKSLAGTRDINTAVDTLPLPPILKSYLKLEGKC